jgi:hypothetical protein
MDRKPPPKIKQQIRREQGFVCAVPDCDNPYLYYHHFDPMWRERQHHEPEGMIALCGEHHPKADAGAFTRRQLRQYKVDAAEHAPEVKGRFDWLRHDMVVASGGLFYICPTTSSGSRKSPRLPRRVTRLRSSRSRIRWFSFSARLSLRRRRRCT